MIHRYCLSLILFLLVFTLPILSSHTACPYDLNAASRLIPAICYANATTTADTCCWLIFITYIYATIRHANLTSEAFLPTPEASTCAFAISASLIHHGLIRPSLNSSDSCKLFRDFGTGTGTPPCPYRTISTIDLSNASLACTAFQSDLSVNRSACIDCRNTLTIASLDLFNVTKGKEFFSCDMAKTIGIWSLAFPSFLRFRSYAACMLQSSMDVGILVTGDLVPFPPPPPSLLLPVPSSSRTIKITAGSTITAVVFIATFIILAVLLYRSWRQRSTMDDSNRRVPISYSLPTQGLYVFTKSELR